ncbi:MAG: AAA family ATPase [Nanoarchaeota archaeon]|nr:AAA family ATPase [Nanoarchaeota archaeon]
MNDQKIKLAIGFSSLPGGGKDFVGDLLVQKYGFYKISPGDIIRSLTKKHGKPVTREEETRIQKRYKEKYGKEYVMLLTYKAAIKSGKKYIAISGIRYPSDYRFFKERLGNRFVNIFVKADKKVRFRRIIERAREDAPKSYREFLREDREEIRTFNLNETERLSEFTISNNDGKKELEKQITKIMNKLKPHFSSK